jgi:hypothetical protein
MKKRALLSSILFFASFVTTASANAQAVVCVSMSNLTLVGASLFGAGRSLR